MPNGPNGKETRSFEPLRLTPQFTASLTRPLLGSKLLYTICHLPSHRELAWLRLEISGDNWGIPNTQRTYGSRVSRDCKPATPPSLSQGANCLWPQAESGNCRPSTIRVAVRVTLKQALVVLQFCQGDFSKSTGTHMGIIMSQIEGQTNGKWYEQWLASWIHHMVMFIYLYFDLLLNLEATVRRPSHNL